MRPRPRRNTGSSPMPSCSSTPGFRAATRSSPQASTSALRWSTGRTRSSSRRTGSPEPPSTTGRDAPSSSKPPASSWKRRRGRPCISCFRCRRNSTCAARWWQRRQLQPDIAIQLDLLLATDTPDMSHRGDVRLGGGPVMSLYSFHGRGTLNGTIPHPALVSLFEETSRRIGIPLQRSAQTGVLTDSSYVQLVGQGVASIDLGFPMRYSHSSHRSLRPSGSGGTRQAAGGRDRRDRARFQPRPGCCFMNH